MFLPPVINLPNGMRICSAMARQRQHNSTHTYVSVSQQETSVWPSATSGGPLDINLTELEREESRCKSTHDAIDHQGELEVAK